MKKLKTYYNCEYQLGKNTVQIDLTKTFTKKVSIENIEPTLKADFIQS